VSPNPGVTRKRVSFVLLVTAEGGDVTKIRNTPNVSALIAAAAWLLVPVAWSMAAVLDREGEGTVFMLLGWAALVVAGVLTLVAIIRITPTENQGRIIQAGFIIHTLGLLASAVMFWFVPLWAALYSVAMVLYALGAPQVRRATLVIAGAMAAGVVSVVVLTALQVGAPDPTYGDYPVAWTTSYFIAAIGAALGTLVLSQHGVYSKSDISAAA